ncbi:MAG TPA: (d)CMP kinase, partial [Chloroflexota bacterium]
PEVDAAVSLVSAHPGVREVMVRRQRQLAANSNIVMVGRDIGTTVLPTAPAKLWLTASPETRAERRLVEQEAGFGGTTPEEVVAGLAHRDTYDAGREASPLRQANDAIVIETDGKTIERTVHDALAEVEKRLPPSRARTVRGELDP